MESDGAGAINVRLTTGRIRLGSNLTVFVATTGNDNNTGLTAGSPFLTPQRAWNYIAANFDLNGFTATIQLANGTYSAANSILSVNAPVFGALGPGNVILNGNAGSPASVVLSSSGGVSVVFASNSAIQVQNLKVQHTTGHGLLAAPQGEIDFTNIIFGAVGTASAFHVTSNGGGICRAIGNYSITGGGSGHMFADGSGAYIQIAGRTVTITGAPVIQDGYAVAFACGLIDGFSCTFVGTVTGRKFDITANGVVNANAAGINYFPGSTAGVTASGGLLL
jgi:hypothetical protein